MPAGVCADGSAPAASSASMWLGERRSAMARSSGGPHSLVGRAASRFQQQPKCRRISHVQGAPQRVGPGNAGAARQQHPRAVAVLQ